MEASSLSSTQVTWMAVAIVVLLVVLVFLALAEMSLSQMTKPRAAALLEKGVRSGKALTRLAEEPTLWVNPLLLTVNVCQTIQATLTGIVAGDLFGPIGVVVGVVANLACVLDRRVTVNLNYTLKAETLDGCVARAGARHVLTSRAFMAWAHERGVRHLINDAGKPTQNAYIESFNGKFRDECLNEQWFLTLHQARQEISRWRRDYNEVRPHSAIGRIPPAQFAAVHRRHAGDAQQSPEVSSQVSRAK